VTELQHAPFANGQVGTRLAFAEFVVDTVDGYLTQDDASSGVAKRRACTAISVLPTVNARRKYLQLLTNHRENMYLNNMLKKG
jgi:hypothetical protein